jgi:uncharacterized protein
MVTVLCEFAYKSDTDLATVPIMKTKRRNSFWQFWLIRVVFTLVLAIAIRIVVAILDGAGLPTFISRALGLVMGTAALIGLGRISWANPRRNGLSPLQPAKGFALGSLTGIFLYACIVSVASIAGWYSIQGISFDVVALLGSFALLVLAAAFEEILYRGIVFQSLEGAVGTGWALALSGTLFGALHLGNTNATLVGALAVGLAGVALGAVFAWTRDLWLLTGLHVMWNFTQGPIFGVAVSGNSFQSLIQPRIQGPEMFTGGAFGFEAGAITIALCAISTIWLVQRTQKAGYWQGFARG